MWPRIHLVLLLIALPCWGGAVGESGVTGIPVDASGGPTIDPTKNVLQLVEAAVRRLDDLRDLSAQLLKARLDHIDEIVKLRAEHAREVRMLESDRLDKIRQVDVLAGTTAADRSQVAIQTLAGVTTANAETLRAMVANTATTIATQTAAANAALTERIASLEKSSYTGAGRSAVADPAMAELVAEMKMLRQAQSANSGKAEGKTDMWGYVVGALGLIGMVISVWISVMKSNRSTALSK